MRHEWRLRGHSETFLIVRRKDLYPPEAETLPPPRMIALLDSWLADSFAKQTVLQIYEQTSSRPTNNLHHYGIDDLRRNVRAHLENAFRRRELVAVRVPRRFLTQTNETIAAKQETVINRPAPRGEQQTTWIKFRVVEDETNQPLAGVELNIRLPGGEETVRQTKSNGVIDIVEIERPGSCSVTSIIKNVAPDLVYGFVAVGEKPAAPPDADDARRAGTLISLPSGVRVASLQAHKVRTGETLAALAKTCGMSWKDLAKFNWGTSDPEEINAHLREVVGCRKKAKDNRNYVFDAQDDPGIVYLPKDWKQDGFATAQTHTIRVNTRLNLVLSLADDLGHPIPDTQYRVTFFDGTHRAGRLGGSGSALIENPPRGPFAVVYPDHEDILVKSLAACVRESFDRRRTDEIFRLLQYPPEIIERARAAYDRFFNDYTGRGLIEDIYQDVTDHDALAAVEGLLAYNRLPTRGEVQIIQRLELDESAEWRQ